MQGRPRLPAARRNPQRCIADTSGAPFCAPECATSNNCNKEAKCVDPGIGTKVCYPRANVCVGDGSLCSPCRSDGDCGEDGICIKGQYTTERACAKKAPGDCKAGEAKVPQGGCAADIPSPAVKVRCLGGVFDEIPRNYCHGIYLIGDQGGDIGCWTPNR